MTNNHCNGICQRFSFKRNYRIKGVSLFAEGVKKCSICRVFFSPENQRKHPVHGYPYCICCNTRLRNKARSTESRQARLSLVYRY